MAQLLDVAVSSTRRRNFMMNTHHRDGLIEWMKGMLNHSFVLDSQESYYDTMQYFESLVEEHRRDPTNSRIREYVPSVGVFHTSLPLRCAFEMYDSKYCISQRHHIAPAFNELRHILNLAQVMAIGKSLGFISFDGDQTLYNDGKNFDRNDELAGGIIDLMRNGVRVCVVTAAGYGLNGPKYEVRLRGLLNRFVELELTSEEISRFYVCGGECNYLLQCSHGESNHMPSERCCQLVPVPYEEWQAEHLQGPRPFHYDPNDVKHVLDIAQSVMEATAEQLKLRCNILRKDRAVGLYPGGAASIERVPVGHGSNKLKRETLDELVLRISAELRKAQPPIRIPYCVFNGGTDVWVDIGNKSVGVRALQAYFQLTPAQCLHVGDQFLNTGNDFSARETCPTIWISSPRETEKILKHISRFSNTDSAVAAAGNGAGTCAAAVDLEDV